MSEVNNNYIELVASLLERGEVEAFGEWDNYLGLGFTKEHVPDLIKMATNKKLHRAYADTTEVWAPIHAWRALGQLRAEQAIEPLVGVFWMADDDDWACEDLFCVMGMIGPACLPHMAKYMSKRPNGYGGRSLAASSIREVALGYPDYRDECIGLLVGQLKKHSFLDSELNGSIVSCLIDLQAIEVFGVIASAYKAKCVDYSVCGDFEDVEIEFGLKRERENEPEYGWVKEAPEELSSDQQQPFLNKEKIGRNDPCPCGSGKKYKKCCLNS